MGIFKLGAIIVSIAGSVGGTTFRRNGSNGTMMNKQRGASPAKLLQNKALGGIGSIFQQWALLTGTQRTAWNLEALNFQFPDKFGTMRNLTGRQLFTKLNVQALPAGFSVLDPTGITSAVPLFDISVVDVDYNSGDYIVNVDNEGDACFFLFQIQQSKQPIYTPAFTSRRVIRVLTITGSVNINIFAEILQNYPQFDVNSSSVVYVTAINSFGFKSVTKSAVY